MQEEVEQKTLTLSINAVKMTGRLLKWMISKYLAHQKQKRIEKTVPGAVKYHGKQTLKALKAAEPNLTSIEITDQNIKDFDRVARKYRVDYALKKDKSGLVPKYYVFFGRRMPRPSTRRLRNILTPSRRKRSRPCCKSSAA